jgi:hypothetical protein
MQHDRFTTENNQQACLQDITEHSHSSAQKVSQRAMDNEILNAEACQTQPQYGTVLRKIELQGDTKYNNRA